MKKIFLSITMLLLTLSLSSFVGNTNQLNNNEKILTLIKEYGENNLSKKFKEYKSINISVDDTIKFKEYIKMDSLGLIKSIELDTSELFRAFKKHFLKQNTNFLSQINNNLNDYEIFDMYIKGNYNPKKIYSVFISERKKLKIDNVNLHACSNIFTFKNENGKIVQDTALFIYSPQNFRMFNSAVKYQEGLSYFGTNSTNREIFTKINKKFTEGK